MKKQKYSIQVLGTVGILVLIYLVVVKMYGEVGRQWIRETSLQLAFLIGIMCGVLFFFILITWIISAVKKRKWYDF